jgi:hypothetical protein
MLVCSGALTWISRSSVEINKTKGYLSWSWPYISAIWTPYTSRTILIGQSRDPVLTRGYSSRSTDLWEMAIGEMQNQNQIGGIRPLPGVQTLRQDQVGSLTHALAAGLILFAMLVPVGICTTGRAQHTFPLRTS